MIIIKSTKHKIRQFFTLSSFVFWVNIYYFQDIYSIPSDDSLDSKSTAREPTVKMIRVLVLRLVSYIVGWLDS